VLEPGKKYPLLVTLHDGPAAMGGPGEASNWYELQFFAARGYAVVFCNPRGSAGYGRDFQRANFRDWGIGPTKDVLYATGFIAKESYVDPSRLVLAGTSYGGYLVSWIIGHDPRFKAAMAQDGVYDLPAFFGGSDQPFLIRRYWGGYPWQKNIRLLLDRDSPMNSVENIKTPLLIVQSSPDSPTEAIQGQILFRNLTQLGSKVEYARYPPKPIEPISVTSPRERLDRLIRAEEFFNRQLDEN